MTPITPKELSAERLAKHTLHVEYGHTFGVSVVKELLAHIAHLEQRLAEEKTESACARAKFKMTHEFREAAEQEAERWGKAYRSEFDKWNAGDPCGHMIRTDATIPGQPYNTCATCQMLYWKQVSERYRKALKKLQMIIPHQHCYTCNLFAIEIRAALTQEKPTK